MKALLLSQQHGCACARVSLRARILVTSPLPARAAHDPPISPHFLPRSAKYSFSPAIGLAALVEAVAAAPSSPDPSAVTVERAALEAVLQQNAAMAAQLSALLA